MWRLKFIQGWIILNHLTTIIALRFKKWFKINIPYKIKNFHLSIQWNETVSTTYIIGQHNIQQLQNLNVLFLAYGSCVNANCEYFSSQFSVCHLFWIFSLLRNLLVKWTIDGQMAGIPLVIISWQHTIVIIIILYEAHWCAACVLPMFLTYYDTGHGQYYRGMSLVFTTVPGIDPLL